VARIPGTANIPPLFFLTLVIYELSMEYEITLTLVPLWTNVRSPREQHNQCSPLLVNIFTGFESSLIGELHPGTGNVHYHGVVRLEDHRAKARLQDRIRQHHKIFGRRSISQLCFRSTWIDYINKSKIETRDIIGDPIVLDDLGILCDPQYRF